MDQQGLMDFMRFLSMSNGAAPGYGGGMFNTSPQPQGQPQFDQFGVQLPPAPGQQVGAPSAPPVGQHMGDVMGQQPMQNPNMLEMIMRLFGQGAQ